MSSLSVTDISEITRQADVLSKPLRDNFTNIKNAINDNQTQINALSSAATNAETTQARPNHTTLNDRLNSINTGQANYIKSGGAVTATAPASMAVDVSAGEANVNGIDIKWSAVTSETLTAPTAVSTGGTSRYDLVVLNYAQTTGGSFVEIVSGAEAEDPVYPSITEDQKVLSILKLNSAMTTITSSDIVDARDQGCYFLASGRWQYKWKIQDAINAVTNGGTIFVGTGEYREDLTFADNQVVFFMGQNDIYDTSGDTVNLDTLDMSDKTNSRLIWPGGDNSSTVETFFAWMQSGNDLNIGAGAARLAALSSTRIAYIDNANNDLRTYDWDGGTWSQTGNDLNIAGVTAPRITALSSSTIAFFDIGNDDLRKYSFDGTDWSQVGNDLNITAGAAAIAGLSENRVAFIDTTNEDLRTYDFDGNSWSQTGNDLNISGIGNPTLTMISSSKVAFFDTTNDELRTYSFDGTDWSQVGNGLSITNTATNSVTMTALRQEKQIAFIDEGNDELRTYRWDGTDWSKVGAVLAISAASSPGITALDSTRIAYYDSANFDLRTYDGLFKDTVKPPSPAFD